MKTLKFLVSSTPDNPELGYGDHWEISIDGKIIDGGHGSTCPNPYKLNNQGLPIPWKLLYGWIAFGTYKAACVDHKKFGKCLMINGGKEVPSKTPNPAHGGQMILTELFVHRGAIDSVNKKWRGSRGCLTVAPDEWDRFIKNWETNESGMLIIEEFICSK